MDKIFAQNLLARLEKELLDKAMKEIKKAEQGHFNKKGTVYDYARYFKKIEMLIEGNFELKTLKNRIEFLKGGIKNAGDKSEIEIDQRYTYNQYFYVTPQKRHFSSFRI